MLTVVAQLPAERARLPVSGGGDYEVATTNLGRRAGLTVASALLVDYVLTVAVSISSGGGQHRVARSRSSREHQVAFAVGVDRACSRP